MPPTALSHPYAPPRAPSPGGMPPPYRPPSAPPGKVGAEAAVLGGAVCKITADKPWGPNTFTRFVEGTAFYPLWSVAVAALTGVRAAQLPTLARGATPAPALGEAGFVLGAAMPVLVLLEVKVALVRFAKARTRRARVADQREATMQGHALAAAILRRRLASRDHGTRPADRAMRKQQRQALRDSGDLDVFLAHRHAVAKHADCNGEVFETTVTMTRDTVVQAGVFATGTLQVIARIVHGVATALPGLGIAGSAASVAMAVAQITTGAVQRRRACQARDAAHARLQALRRSRLALALAQLAPGTEAATVCAAHPLSPRRQGIVGEADAARLQEATGFYRMAMRYCDDRLSDALVGARNEVRNCTVRIGYGAGALGINGALLGLGIAAVATVTVATAGTALLIAGGVLGGAWLCFGIYKLRMWWRGRSASQRAAATAQRALQAASGDDAATGKAIDAASKRLVAAQAGQAGPGGADGAQNDADAAAASEADAEPTAALDPRTLRAMHRHLIATRVVQHLQARGSAQALAERSLARELMATLGADPALVMAIEDSQTPEQCRLALKLVLRHLDGGCIDAARAAAALRERGAPAGAGEHANAGANPSADGDADDDTQARTPLLRPGGGCAGEQ